MGKRRGFRGLGMQFTLLILALATGCSRPGGLQGTADNHQPDPQSVPFHQGGDTSPVGNSGPHASEQRADIRDESDAAGSRSVPFKTGSCRLLPAGTLLTVRLQSSLSSAGLDTGKTFVAAVDEPLVVGGSTVVSREATVRGRVESARVSDVRRDAGYVRLTLESIRIDGKDVPLQTSSLFARGSAGDVHDWTADPSGIEQSTSIRVKKGRRLTFRLTEPADLDNGTGSTPVSKKPPLSSKTQPTTE